MGFAAPGGGESRDRRIQDEINFTPALRQKMEAKLAQYEARLFDGQHANYNEWLDDHVRVTILHRLRAQGVAEYWHLRRGIEQAQGDNFNPHVFDDAWLVIQFYLEGRGDELEGGAGLS